MEQDPAGGDLLSALVLVKGVCVHFHWFHIAILSKAEHPDP